MATRQRSRIPRREFLQQKIRRQRCGAGKQCAGLVPGSSSQSVYGSDYKMSDNRDNAATTHAFRSNFPFKVWEALLRIEPGQVLSYSQLARQAGNPRAARAIGSALAANTIGFLIPCHRVLRESGDIGEYRWGSERKAAMIAWEASHVSATH